MSSNSLTFLRSCGGFAVGLLLLTLLGCSRHEDDLSLACEGQRHVLRGDVSLPGNGVRDSVQAREVKYSLEGRKLEGIYECQVWNAAEVRCDLNKPDGTQSRSFRFDRESTRVQDHVLTRGRTLTEDMTFEGECKAL